MDSGWIRVSSALLLFISLSRGAAIELRGTRTTFQIDPATLEVRAENAISAPLPAQRVSGLAVTEHAAAWTLADPQIAIRASVQGDALIIEFEAATPGEFAWPTVLDAGEALVLPLSEGSYVPTGDDAWAKYLIDQGPLNTTAGLSMPFFAVAHAGTTITYILTNPFNNEIHFEETGGRLGLQVSHRFTGNNPVKRFGVRIQTGDASPVTPAMIYRQYLRGAGGFTSFQQKLGQTPDAARLLGAAHIYLWGDGIISQHDIRDFKSLAKAIKVSELWPSIDEESRKLLDSLSGKDWVDNYDRMRVADLLNGLFERGVTTPEILSAMLPGQFAPLQEWGNGWSRTMIQSLRDAGIDRAWLGSPSWAGLSHHPSAVRLAIESGFLVGPYDSFHSIHSPAEADSWETAQFDQSLYDNGAVISADGKPRAGFKQKGHILSPRYARPAVERRITRLASQFHCNSWFVDCDAFGDVFDDYSPLHPSTQAEDAAERVSRMLWIRDRFNMVIGSEGGSAYATPAIHFAHGIVTPGFGWGDPEMYKNRESKYYLGPYFPPDEPAIFFKQAPVKDEYWHVCFDPRFRLPLYEIVFHDSVIATHQWGFGSLKFEDRGHARELIELLYNVPPLYHVNRAQWQKRQGEILKHYRLFSPLHRVAGGKSMTGFGWMTEDRLVQRTTFETGLVLTANFSDRPFQQEDSTVPPRSVEARNPSTGLQRVMQLGN